jgi:quercetin dioxygenase-like cupin family protein
LTPIPTQAEHKASTGVSVQVLIGRLAIKLNGETAKISARQILVIEREVLHEVTSLEESAFLISISGVGENSR